MAAVVVARMPTPCGGASAMSCNTALRRVGMKGRPRDGRKGVQGATRARGSRLLPALAAVVVLDLVDA